MINLTHLLTHHGEYEDAHIHDLLRQKNSNLHLAIEKEHQEHERAFNNLIHQLGNVAAVQDHSEKIHMGNEFYFVLPLIL